MFSKNVRTLYFYIVAFISLIILVSSFVATVNSVANHFYPVNYSTYYYSEAEKEAMATGIKVAYPSTETSQEQLLIETENAKRENIKNILTSFALFVISLPLYGFHWRTIQKDRKNIL